MGKKLPANGMSRISKFIQQYYSNEATIIWQQLTEYKTCTGTFDLPLAWNTINNIDPVAWWRGNFEISAPELCKVAVRILEIPSSSAASERNWSTFSYIHDKKRNRLTNERVMKLVYIYSNYKLTRPRQESLDVMEAAIRFNNRSISEDTRLGNHDFLDPDISNIPDDEYEELSEDVYEEFTETEYEDVDSVEEDSNDE